MALWERARRLAVGMANVFGHEWHHGGGEEREAEASARMALKDAMKPYAELCEAADLFLTAKQFSLPVDGVGYYIRLREAAEKYRLAKKRDEDTE